MSAEVALVDWITDRYSEIIERLSAKSALGAESGVLLTAGEWLTAFQTASAMPADTEQACALKREALERVLPCEEEAYAAACEADGVRSLLEAVVPRTGEEADELLARIRRDMTELVRSFYFMTEDAGPSWWYR